VFNGRHKCYLVLVPCLEVMWTLLPKNQAWPRTINLMERSAGDFLVEDSTLSSVCFGC
jgi:hypothetical protein